MNNNELAKILYIPYWKIVNNEKKFVFHEYQLEWSTKKGGSYKDNNGKSKRILFTDVTFYNNVRKLLYIAHDLTQLFSTPKAYIDFWRKKRHELFNWFNKILDKKETSWLVTKMFTSSNVFLNTILSLYSTIASLIQTYIDDNVNFNYELLNFKKNLILDTYAIVQSLIIAINSIYLSLNVSGKDLVKYDKNLDKMNNENFQNIPNSIFWKYELSEQFKKDYDDILLIRTIIVHPFSVKESGSNNSYWQIIYHPVKKFNFNHFGKMNDNEILLLKMNATNVKNIEDWINIPDINNLNFFEECKFPVVDICIRMLNEILHYFKSSKLK